MSVGNLDTITYLRRDVEVMICLPAIKLKGYLSVPKRPRGIMVFAYCCRNIEKMESHLAERLCKNNFATLVVNLLTRSEVEMDKSTHHLRFDVNLLATRLSMIISWVRQYNKIGCMPLGLYSTSTDAATAIVAAARRPEAVKTVVSFNGRPDMAGKKLLDVKTPVLLVVEEGETELLKLNQAANMLLGKGSCLEVIQGAGSSENGSSTAALTAADDIITRWVRTHLPDNIESQRTFHGASS